MRKACWYGVRQTSCSLRHPAKGIGHPFVRGISQFEHERAYLRRLMDMEAEAQAGKRWRLVGSIVVRRFPLIVPDPDPIEEKYERFRLGRENFLSIDEATNLELMEEDRKRGSKVSKTQKKKEKKKEMKEEGGQSRSSKDNNNQAEDEVDQLYQKREEVVAREETLEEVRAKMERLAPRVTTEDMWVNQKSLRRALASSLYLVVKKPRDRHAWQFPQGGREPGETMRQVESFMLLVSF